jgi:hypothetical protein
MCEPFSFDAGNCNNDQASLMANVGIAIKALVLKVIYILTSVELSVEPSKPSAREK